MNIKSYHELVEEQLNTHPDTTIISAKKFLKYHINDHVSLKVIITIMNTNDNLLFYYIAKGPTGSTPQSACNGIRTGLGGEYCSFSHIDITK